MPAVITGAGFGWLVASGGLYGNGQLNDASTGEVVGGLMFLVAGILPVVLVVGLAVPLWKARRAPGWLTLLGWLAAIGASFMLSLALPDPDPLLLATVPFTLGLWGYLLTHRRGA